MYAVERAAPIHQYERGIVFTFYSSCSESAPGSAAPPQDSEDPTWQQKCESVKLEVERPAPESEKKEDQLTPFSRMTVKTKARWQCYKTNQVLL